MDADAVGALARATVNGSMPFPQIVGELIAQGVEYSHVDYAASSFRGISTLNGSPVPSQMMLDLIQSDRRRTAAEPRAGFAVVARQRSAYHACNQGQGLNPSQRSHPC